MLSFEPYPFPYFVLTHWHHLGGLIEGVESCFSMLFDKLMSLFYGLIVCDARWLFHCTWAVSQEKFVRAVFSGHVGPTIMYKSRNGEPHIPVILSC